MKVAKATPSADRWWGVSPDNIPHAQYGQDGNSHRLLVVAQPTRQTRWRADAAQVAHGLHFDVCQTNEMGTWNDGKAPRYLAVLESGFGTRAMRARRVARMVRDTVQNPLLLLAPLVEGIVRMENRAFWRHLRVCGEVIPGLSLYLASLDSGLERARHLAIGGAMYLAGRILVRTTFGSLWREVPSPFAAESLLAVTQRAANQPLRGAVLAYVVDLQPLFAIVHPGHERGVDLVLNMAHPLATPLHRIWSTHRTLEPSPLCAINQVTLAGPMPADEDAIMENFLKADGHRA